jgi:non-ribosomal peptide synthetase component E (peptide arylation enzyme)
MNLAQLLQRQALLAPDRPALLHGSVPYATHGQWASRAAALAARLRGAGLAPGDRVLLFMRNHPRYLELHGVRALLAAQPGVAAVHDLHVWAMGTTQVALTAHLVMPEGGGDRAFLQRCSALLAERLGIGHVTLQVVRQPRAAAAPAPPAH